MFKLKSFALAALLAVLPLSSQAMDPRFTDADGDLVADAPTDPKDWIDPTTLIFSYTPVEDPAVYAEVWKEFIEHLAAETGKKSSVFSGSK